MLRRMIRRYTRAEYVERADRLRAARPGMTLSTDIIVGFPGETEEDFVATLSLVREVGFTSLFGFKFSPRPHTPALRLEDDVPEATKSERLARLFEVSETLGRAHLATLVGTRQRVLIEGESRGEGGAPFVSGRTDQNEIVHVEAPAGRDSVGQMAVVEIVRANKHSLAGRFADPTVLAFPLARRPVEERRALPLAP
jgi:tRNA-2-methylthio-N6-dimethylallyladenosine synthase